MEKNVLVRWLEFDDDNEFIRVVRGTQRVEPNRVEQAKEAISLRPMFYRFEDEQ